MANQWEYDIVSAVNTFADNNGERCSAIRLPQRMFTDQGVDVLAFFPMDCRVLAIEAKSVGVKVYEALYFSDTFRQHDETGQITGISSWTCDKIIDVAVAVQIRHGKGHPSEAYLVPWTEILKRWWKGEKKITFEEVRAFPRFLHYGRNWEFTVEMHDWLLNGNYEV